MCLDSYLAYCCMSSTHPVGHSTDLRGPTTAIVEPTFSRTHRILFSHGASMTTTGTRSLVRLRQVQGLALRPEDRHTRAANGPGIREYLPEFGVQEWGVRPTTEIPLACERTTCPRARLRNIRRTDEVHTSRTEAVLTRWSLKQLRRGFCEPTKRKRERFSNWTALISTGPD